MSKDLGKLLKRLGRFEENFPLADFNTFRIGGRCDYFFIPSSSEALLEALKIFKKISLNYYILGKGSNLLISSKGIKGVVVKPEFREFFRKDKNGTFYIGSSVSISSILGLSLKNCLGGLEFLGGLPATLGGSLVNNASFKGRSIFEAVKKVKVLDTSREKIFFIDKGKVDYGYRFSSLKEFVVLGAELCFYPKAEPKIKEDIRKIINYRLKTQELGKKSAGCIFKNPKENLSAGKLIEEANLKGFRKGQASVSSKHANFIINHKDATSSDIIFLIEYIKEKVYNKFGVLLEEEIERWQC